MRPDVVVLLELLVLAMMCRSAFCLLYEPMAPAQFSKIRLAEPFNRAAIGSFAGPKVGFEILWRCDANVIGDFPCHLIRRSNKVFVEYFQALQIQIVVQ